MTLFDTTRISGTTMIFQIDKFVHIPFVWCSAGKSTLGTNNPRHSSELGQPQITIELTQGYWIAQTPLTRKQVKSIGV